MKLLWNTFYFLVFNVDFWQYQKRDDCDKESDKAQNLSLGWRNIYYEKVVLKFHIKWGWFWKLHTSHLKYWNMNWDVQERKGRWEGSLSSQRHEIRKDPYTSLGTGDGTKTDEFSEKFQTAFDPQPPSFSENHIAVFFWKAPFKALYKCPQSAI